jgi:hypothetical protein
MPDWHIDHCKLRLAPASNPFSSRIWYYRAALLGAARETSIRAQSCRHGEENVVSIPSLGTG